MNDLHLDGCRVDPLASYLRGLGVLRIVSEQLDPAVTGQWQSDHLVLRTDRGLDELADFLLDAYRPTPLVSPWNGGSGFHPKDKTDGIDAIEASETERLGAYREAVAAARRLVAHPDWSTMSKDQQVQACRNQLPDVAIPWLDAAVVLSGGGIRFPPLLGTGGNVGRLEFSNNLMQRLADVMCLRDGRRTPTREHSRQWLLAALVGGPAGALVKGAVGQLDPGAAGGTAAPEGGPEQSLVNPWAFVLAFEGALVFASGAARRLAADGGPGAAGQAAMPFTFEPTAVGYGTAAPGESAKGELWAPIWACPATYGEVSRLVGEGRVEWAGRHARRGVDAARAAASLGVDRGIDGFARHVFVERMGQSMLAVPVGRLATARESRIDVPVLADLDGWVDRVRTARNLPAAAAARVRAVDAAMFAHALRRSPQRLLDVLVAAAALEGAVARSRELRRQIPNPLGHASRNARSGPLAADRWLPHLDDGSIEFRLAAGLASGRDRPIPPGTADGERHDRPAALLRAVRYSTGRRMEWQSDGRAVVGGLGSVQMADVLAALVQRRAIGPGGTTTTGLGALGIEPAFAVYAVATPLDDVLAFYTEDVDDDRLAQLTAALLLLHFPAAPTASDQGNRDHTPEVRSFERGLMPAAAALTLPFFHHKAMRFALGGDPVRLRPAPNWPRLLHAGRVRDVVADARHRLRIAGLTPLVAADHTIARQVDGRRLLAATAYPLTDRDVRYLVGRVAVSRERLDSYPKGGQ